MPKLHTESDHHDQWVNTLPAMGQTDLCLNCTHLGVRGLRAAGPPSKLRPLLGLFCFANREPADAMETVLPSKEPVSGEMREESM